VAQYWVQPLPPFHIADAAAYNTSVTLTDVSPLPAKALPANFLVIGNEIELVAWGQFSTTGTPTLLLGFYYGGVAGVALGATAATTTGSGAAAWPWIMRYYGKVRAIGTSGQIVGQGVLELGTSLTAMSPVALPATAAARTATIDTTVLKTLTVGAQWNTSSASNTLTVNDFSVRIIN
jgi:hypothetical protein